jgi:hypothetical protein
LVADFFATAFVVPFFAVRFMVELLLTVADAAEAPHNAHVARSSAAVRGARDRQICARAG